MSERYYGMCLVRHSALAVAVHVNAPLDRSYTELFAERARPYLCVAVVRQVGSPPRRCLGRRRGYNSKLAAQANECCIAHRRVEHAARAWVAAMAEGGVP